MGFLLPARPTSAVRSSRASAAGRAVGGVETKEEKEGPALRRSRNVVCSREGAEGGGEVEEVAVA